MTLSRWERLADWPLMATSVLFLVAYSAQVLSSGILLQSIAGWVLIAAWGVFLVDYVVSLYLAGARGRWFIHHLLDLATVALPVLRPLRLLRLVKLISVLQRVAGNALRGRVVTYVVASSALLVYVGALAMYDAEKGHSGSNIASFGDSLWWAVVTITTVGYGDYSPVTTGGRLIAVGLMIGGIALLGAWVSNPGNEL